MKTEHSDTIPVGSANIRDVARHAGVSIGTVSLVLNNRPYVSQDKRQRVKRAAEQLGYVPNLIGKALNQHRCGVVGVIAPVAQSLNFSSIIAGVNSEAERSGRSIFASFSQDSPAIEARMVKIFRQLHVDGIVLAAAPGRDNVPLLRELIDSGVAIVQVERKLRGIESDFVGSQHDDAVRKVVRRMLEQGHKRIGFAMTTSPYSVNEERLRSYESALREAGIAVDPRWVLRIPSPPKVKVQDALAAVTAYLQQPDTPPAILWCASFIPAMVQAIRQRGWVNGRDADIVLFEIESEMDVGGQAFEYIMQDGMRIGREAARLVLRRSEELIEAGKDPHADATPAVEVRFPCVETHVAQHLTSRSAT